MNIEPDLLEAMVCKSGLGLYVVKPGQENQRCVQHCTVTYGQFPRRQNRDI